MDRARQEQRSQAGSSLIEMLISTMIMSLVSSALLGLLMLNDRAAARVSDKTDCINNARTVIERVGRDVRMARSLGDVYGGDLITGGGGMRTQGSNTFPSATDPLYGASQAPPQGWPSQSSPASTMWPSPPWTLTNTCLVAQVPIFYANPTNSMDPSNGWPTMIPQGAGNPPTVCPQDNVETHVYMVVADPDQVNHSGEYQLEMAALPGYPVQEAGAPQNLLYNPANVITQPRVLLKGIVGPIDTSSGLPKVFQYLNKIDGTGTPQDSVSSATVPNFTGVVMNYEIKVQNQMQAPQVMAFKTEVFLRNNALATTTGQPSTVTPTLSPTP